jgi:glycine dehydrogenase subunit 1
MPIRHVWMANSDDNAFKAMLNEIGVKSIDELFNDIPEGIKFKGELKVGFNGRTLSEYEVRKVVNEILKKNRDLKCPPFIGGGIYPHCVPSIINFIIQRAEFLTSYTPYQPEASQGMLQALFEYQSLMAELLKMDIVNSSMYDWSTSLAEAALMANRVNGKRKILVPESMNPFHRKVLETWISGKGLKVESVRISKDTGLLDLDDLMRRIDNDTSSVYIENPSFIGVIEENVKSISEIARDKKSLFIVGVDPISLGIIKPPGLYGADIVVGDSQSLGLYMNFGGPTLGIFAIREDQSLVKQIPGRIVGMTRDLNGNRAFTLIWQTRDQFVRREKATSNITTNEALLAIASSIYMVYLGYKGIRKIDEIIIKKSHYLAYQLSKLGLRSPAFKGRFFKEFVVDLGAGLSYSKLRRKLIENGIDLGIYIKDKLSLDFLLEPVLICVTEIHEKKYIDEVINIIKGDLNV